MVSMTPEERVKESLGSYAQRKTDHVSNQTGSSISEINLVTAVAPCAILLWSVLQSRHGLFEDQRSIPAAITDFALNACAILLVTTLYSDIPGILVGLMLASAAFFAVAPANKRPGEKKPAKPPQAGDEKEETKMGPFPLRPYITSYRGTMMVITCSSILAVDFNVFPRRFAKVETWGTSLMDLGVGSFVFSAGVVAAKGSLKEALLPSKDRPSLPKRIFNSLRQALPLLVLGGARVLSVKGLEYPEHVTEYGVHWNFFFTMALVPLALAFLQPIMHRIPGPSYAVAGLGLTAIFAVVLETTDLKKWALTAPRTDLLSANREGITSNLGYLAIFLLGMSTGTLTLPREPLRSAGAGGPIAIILDRIPMLRLEGVSLNTNQRATRLRARLISSLLLSALGYTALLYMHSLPRQLPWLVTSVSRRLANAPYVLWVAAFNNAQIAAFCLVETFCFPSVYRAKTPAAEKSEARRATSKVLDDFNSGGLPLFLLANLGTGAVNLAIKTLDVGNMEATALLVAYMGVLTIAARWVRGIKLRI